MADDREWLQVFKWKLMPHLGGSPPPKSRCLYSRNRGVSVAIGYRSGEDSCLYIDNSDGTKSKKPLTSYDEWAEFRMVPDEDEHTQSIKIIKN